MKNKMSMGYDGRNDRIYCINAYECKEALKAMGFRWDGISRCWSIACPKDLTTMGNLICDIIVDCKLDCYDVCLCDFLDVLVAAKGEFSMDDAHLAKFQAATADI